MVQAPRGELVGTALYTVLAPVSVVAALVVMGDVLAAFAVYHLGVCLLLPALDSLLRGRSLSVHLRGPVALRSPGGAGWTAGAVVGVVMGVGAVVPYALAGEALIPPADVQRALAGWNVGPEETWALFAYMLVFNSGAEELFWRGFLQTRLEPWLCRNTRLLVLTTAFASYHLFTVYALVRDWSVAVAALAAVFVGGFVWALMRDRYDSVWPPLLAHGGATLGYMTVYVVWLA